MASHTAKSFDVERARHDTPGCTRVLHFNNAGAALPPAPVLEATLSYLRREAEIGGYETEREYHAQIEALYPALARLLNTRPDEIAYVDCATRAWDMAFYGVPLQPGDILLSCVAEYASNYIALLHRARQTGATIETVPNDACGQMSLDALADKVREFGGRVKLLSLTHVPTNGGLVNPAVEAGKIARENGILYLLDACQSVGQIPLDVAEIGCDLLSATGRKYLRGPRGTGFLYVRREAMARLDPPFLDMFAAEWTETDRYVLRDDARRFETWEANYAAKCGLGVAVEYVLQWGIGAIQERVTYLAALLRESLSQVPGVTVQDRGANLCGIVTFSVANHPSETIRAALAAHAINVTVAIRSGTRHDMQARELTDLVRASVHYYNTEAEIARFCEMLSIVTTASKNFTADATDTHR
jgi:selenocysteine lyase/cysteine desulfurase